MIALLFSLLCVYAASTLIGMPLYRFLATRWTVPFTATFLPSTLGILVAGVAWTWAFGVGGGITFVNIALCVSLIVGLFGATIRIQQTWRDLDRTTRKVPRSTLPFIIGFIGVCAMSIPSWDGIWTSTYPARIGPDAASYVGAANTIKSVTSYSEYKKQIEERSSRTLEELLKPESPMVYSIPSFTDQIGTELLLGAHRWAVPGLVASVTQLMDDQNVFLSLNSLTLLAILLSFGLVFETVKSHQFGFWLKITSGVAFIGSPAVIAPYYDGFSAQLISLPFLCLAVVAVTAHDQSAPTSSRVIRINGGLLVLASAGLTVLYADAMIFVGLLSLAFMSTLLFRRQKLAIVGLNSRENIFAVGCVLLWLFPLIRHLPSWFLARLSQVTSNGYWQPTWLSPIELFGLPIWYRSSNVQEAVKEMSTVIGGAGEILIWLVSIIAFVAILRTLRSNGGITTTLIATSIVAYVIFAMASLSQESNYQFAKVMSYALPIVWIATMTTLAELKKKYPRKLTYLTCVLTLTILSAASLNIVTFPNGLEIPRYSSQITRDTSDPRVAQVLRGSVIIAPADHILMGSAIAASDVNWAYRGFGGINPNLETLRDRAVYWLVFDEGKMDLDCLVRKIGNQQNSTDASSLALFQLSSNAHNLDSTSESAKESLENFYAKHGLGDVESDWLPTQCRDRVHPPAG